MEPKYQLNKIYPINSILDQNHSRAPSMAATSLIQALIHSKRRAEFMLILINEPGYSCDNIKFICF